MIRRGPMHARRTLLTAGILALCAACSSSPKKSDPTPGPGPAERPSVNLNGKYDEAISEESGGNYRDAYTRFMEIQGVDPEFKDLNTRLEGYTELVTIQRDIEDLRMAVAMHEDVSKRTRQIFGVAHPSTKRRQAHWELLRSVLARAQISPHTVVLKFE